MDFYEYEFLFETCKKQIKKLFDKGYLINFGDNDMPDSKYVPKGTIRHKIDQNLSDFEKKYLIEKISEFCSLHNVVYEIRGTYHVTLVSPDLLFKINESTTYQEMAKQLNKEDYITAYAYNDCVKFYLNASTLSHLISSTNLQKGLDDGIKASSCSVGSYRAIRITSEKCTDIGHQKEKIDALFM